MVGGRWCPLEQSSGAGFATNSVSLCESPHSSMPFTYLQNEKSNPGSTELGASITRLQLPLMEGNGSPVWECCLPQQWAHLERQAQAAVGRAGTPTQNAP